MYFLFHIGKLIALLISNIYICVLVICANISFSDKNFIRFYEDCKDKSFYEPVFHLYKSVYDFCMKHEIDTKVYFLVLGISAMIILA